jgi:hypothetical protein
MAISHCRFDSPFRITVFHRRFASPSGDAFF